MQHVCVCVWGRKKGLHGPNPCFLYWRERERQRQRGKYDHVSSKKSLDHGKGEGERERVIWGRRRMTHKMIHQELTHIYRIVIRQWPADTMPSNEEINHRSFVKSTTTSTHNAPIAMNVFKPILWLSGSMDWNTISNVYNVLDVSWPNVHLPPPPVNPPLPVMAIGKWSTEGKDNKVTSNLRKKATLSLMMENLIVDTIIHYYAAQHALAAVRLYWISLSKMILSEVVGGIMSVSKFTR